MTKAIAVNPTTHRSEDRLKLLCSFDKETTQVIKQIPGRKWSASMQCWHIPNNTSIEELNQKYAPNISFQLENITNEKK